MSNPTPEPGSSDRLEADAAARDSANHEQTTEDAAAQSAEVDAAVARSHEEAGHTAVIPPEETTGLTGEPLSSAPAAPAAPQPAAEPVAPPVAQPASAPAAQTPVDEPILVEPYVPGAGVDTATAQYTSAEQAAAAHNPVQQAPAQYVPAQQAWSEPGIAGAPVEPVAPAAAPAPAEDFESHPYPAAAYVPVGDQVVQQQAFVPSQPQFPLYVQAPEQPKDRGNRGFGILIGLLGTVVFAAIYAAAVSGLALAFGGGAGVGRSNDFVEILTTLVTSWVFIAPVIAFFVAWVIASVIINRAGWVHWVLGGVLIGLVTYVAWFGGLLLEQRAWNLGGTATLRLLLDNAFAFGPVVAFIVAREVPVWLGGWIAAHGRKVRAENIEAQREYEQVLEAGPTVAS